VAWVWESISPGSSVWPAPSMTVAPAGTASVGRTALIVEPLIRTSWAGCRWTPSNTAT